MGESVYSRRDYLKVILGGVLIVMLISSISFLLSESLPSYPVILATFLTGTFACGLLVRWKKRSVPDEHQGQWLRRNRTLASAGFLIIIVVIFALIALFQIIKVSILLPFAMLDGACLAAFLLVLKPPGMSGMYVQGIRRAAYMVMFGCQALAITIILLQALPYVSSPIAVGALVVLLVSSSLVYYFGKLATP